MFNQVKLILVDDNASFLEGLESLLANDIDYQIIGKFLSSDDLLESDTLGLADIILLDIEMPGKNGIETALQVNFMFPQIKMIAITMYQEKVYLQQLIGAGFKGFVNKTMVGEKIFSTLKSVQDNKFLFPDDIEMK